MLTSCFVFQITHSNCKIGGERLHVEIDVRMDNGTLWFDQILFTCDVPSFSFVQHKSLAGGGHLVLLHWFVQYSGKLLNTGSMVRWSRGGGGHCKTKEIKILKCNPNKNRTRANVINISNCTIFEMQVKSKFYFNVQTKAKSVIFVWKLNFLSYSLQTGTKKAICLQITMCVWKLNILECHFSQYLTLFSLQLENNTSA